jgi:hypothetical protein
MHRERSGKWPALLVAILPATLAAILAAPACTCVTLPTPVPGPPPAPSPPPGSKVPALLPAEEAAHGQFRIHLADPATVLDITDQTPALAQAELTTLFDGLDSKLRSQISFGEVQCLRNGCARDVYYPNWETFEAVNQAVLMPRTDGPRRAQGHFSISRSGRVRQGNGFVVTWALLFPAKLPALNCPPVRGCAQQ